MSYVQLDPVELAGDVKQRLVDFAADTSFVKDEKLRGICRMIWSGKPETGGLVSNIWVESTFPAESSSLSIDDLVKQNKFNAELRNQLQETDAFNCELPLYKHQLRSIEAARMRTPRPGLIISSGTGTGKTESFLFPILDDLFSSEKLPGQGTRCIIVYPMNALVNDQVDRLHRWLRGQDKVTLFHFTSETPEDKKRADDLKIPEWDKDKCRFRTRQEARGLQTRDGKHTDGDPSKVIAPDIIITNYSMLEYALCRPQDNVFFGPALRAIVLDEAHLYNGTLAAEMTLLLRRILERCDREPNDILHIASSATIGSGKTADLRRFASQIFSKDEQNIEAVIGKSERAKFSKPRKPRKLPKAADVAGKQWLLKPTIVMNKKGEQELAGNEKECIRLRDELSVLTSPEVIENAYEECSDLPARLLRTSLESSEIIQKIENVLWEKRSLPIQTLAFEIWEEDGDEAIDATIKLLQMASSARNKVNDYPIVPHRIHLLTRASEGFSVCLDNNCYADDSIKLDGLGAVDAGFHYQCRYCGSTAMRLVKCGNCGEWGLFGEVLTIDDDSKIVSSNKRDIKVAYTHRKISGASKIKVDTKTGKLCVQGKEPAVQLFEMNDCPDCINDNSWTDLTITAGLTQSIIVETMLSNMPVIATDNMRWLPAQGRRMLVFSDSRSEAAKLGSGLRMRHEIQLIRAAFASFIDKEGNQNDELFKLLEEKIMEAKQELTKPDLSHAVRRFIEKDIAKLEQQLAESRSGGSVKEWVSRLGGESIISEILADDEIHLAEDWLKKTQTQWELNLDAIRDRLTVLIARELAAPSRKAQSLETLGLVDVMYPSLAAIQPPADFAGLLPTDETRKRFEESWTDFFALLCDSLRSSGCITLGSDKDDVEYMDSRHHIGTWCTRERGGPWLEAFVGSTKRQARRWFAYEYCRKIGLEDHLAEELSAELLKKVFELLAENAGSVLKWIELDDRQTEDGPAQKGIRFIFPNLALRIPPGVFKCLKTGLLWSRSALGLAPHIGCDSLALISNDEADKDPRYGRMRRELVTSKVFRTGVWSEEHSAQLSQQENRRLQDLFKIGARNILSSTTTLELGIDIGGLNGVFMANVPPGKANYLQRSGRAGRRADGTSVAVTYARSRPFDKAVFQNFDKFLSAEMKNPRILLDREKVIRRHLHAFILGEFFRRLYSTKTRKGAMDAYGKMGDFCGVLIPHRWDGPKRPPVEQLRVEISHLINQPWFNPSRGDIGLEGHFLDFLHWQRDYTKYELKPKLIHLTENTILQEKLYDWTRAFNDTIDAFANAVAVWRKDYEALLLTWFDIEEGQAARRVANSIRYQLLALRDTTVIEALCDKQFLPHYGFPIGVQSLKVVTIDEKYKALREEDQFRLERSGLLALGEYVPGSKLLVGGKVITSHGLKKHWTGANIDNYIGLRGSYGTCGKKHFYYSISGDLGACPICGSGQSGSTKDLLFIKHGFSTAVWDPPKRTADLDPSVGQVEKATITFCERPREGALAKHLTSFAGIDGLVADFREDCEILVFNKGKAEFGFAICLKCGFADSEASTGLGRMELPKRFEQHLPLTSDKKIYCWSPQEAPVLRNQVLAAREPTEAVLVDFYNAIGPISSRDEQLIKTIESALVIAGARLLQIDARELGSMLISLNDYRSKGIVIHDDVPGGAGHVRELLDFGRAWLEEAVNILYVNEEHDKRCNNACLECILSFGKQYSEDEQPLKRRETLKLLRELLSEEFIMPVDEIVEQQSLLSDSQMTDKQRIGKAQARLSSRKAQRGTFTPAL